MEHQPLWKELGRSRPFEVPQQEAYLNLARTHAELTGPFHALFRAHGLSEATYNALRIIRGAGDDGCRCSHIARNLVVRVPDVTRLVDRLVDAGLASRDRSSHDRRVVIVQLTDNGAARLARLDQPVLDQHRAQLGALTPDELDTLNRLLAKARMNPGSTADPAPSTKPLP